MGKNTYVVQTGDSWTKIAEKLYNNQLAFEELIDANRASSGRKIALHAGMTLNVPDPKSIDTSFVSARTFAEATGQHLGDVVIGSAEEGRTFAEAYPWIPLRGRESTVDTVDPDQPILPDPGISPSPSINDHEQFPPLHSGQYPTGWRPRPSYSSVDQGPQVHPVNGVAGPRHMLTPAEMMAADKIQGIEDYEEALKGKTESDSSQVWKRIGATAGHAGPRHMLPQEPLPHPVAGPRHMLSQEPQVPLVKGVPGRTFGLGIKRGQEIMPYEYAGGGAGVGADGPTPGDPRFALPTSEGVEGSYLVSTRDRSGRRTHVIAGPDEYFPRYRDGQEPSQSAASIGGTGGGRPPAPRLYSPGPRGGGGRGGRRGAPGGASFPVGRRTVLPSQGRAAQAARQNIFGRRNGFGSSGRAAIPSFAPGSARANNQFRPPHFRPYGYSEFGIISWRI